MSIRREDKEFIQGMAVLGALLGICIGAFLIMHLSDSAHKRQAQEREYLQTHAALMKLSTTTVTPNNPIASKEVLDQVQQQMEQDPVEEADVAKSFWVTIPRWKLWSFCALGGSIGAVIGYVSIWLTGWAGSVLLYQFLRLLYAGIRQAAPHCAAAEQAAVSSEQTGGIQYQRNDKRILPTVIKLLFLLVLILVLLTIVVWRLTNL